jgi:hypothetical protein
MARCKLNISKWLVTGGASAIMARYGYNISTFFATGGKSTKIYNFVLIFVKKIIVYLLLLNFIYYLKETFPKFWTISVNGAVVKCTRYYTNWQFNPRNEEDVIWFHDNLLFHSVCHRKARRIFRKWKKNLLLNTCIIILKTVELHVFYFIFMLCLIIICFTL